MHAIFSYYSIIVNIVLSYKKLIHDNICLMKTNIKKLFGFLAFELTSIDVTEVGDLLIPFLLQYHILRKYST